MDNIIVRFYLLKNQMKQKIQVAMILLLLWLLLVVVTSQVRAGEVGKRNDFM
jgi:hypothetical protein